MHKKTKSMIDFFNRDSVKLSIPFPISCFNKNIWNTQPFKFDVKIKGRRRNFVFFGKNYGDFLTDGKIFNFLKKFRKLKFYKHTNNSCFSFTDIYELNKIRGFNNNKKSYSSVMYKHYKEFEKIVKECNEQYDYHAFIDISSYYDSIYTHFLRGFNYENIDKFTQGESKYADKEFIKKETKKWINDFCAAFENKLNFNKQSNGLAIGNGISDFVAELFNKLIDFFVTYCKKMKYMDIIRYRDDIFIFGNHKENVKELYNKYCSILNIFKLSINPEKSYGPIKGEIKFYKDEKEYRKELLKNNKYTYLKRAYKFTKKYPRSNLIFYLLKKIYLNEQIKTKKDIESLWWIFNNSETNVLPLILSIIDKTKRDVKNKFFIFLKCNKFQNNLTLSDKIWISCFMNKNNIKNNLINNDKKFNLLWKKISGYLNNDKSKINLFYDADKWSYGETLSH